MTLTDDEVDDLIRARFPLWKQDARDRVMFAAGLETKRGRREAYMRGYDAGLAAIPKEPTQSMQEAGADAMFVEGDRTEQMRIVRKGWRAMWDAAQGGRP